MAIVLKTGRATVSIHDYHRKMMFFSLSGQFCKSLVPLNYDVYNFKVSGRATVEKGCYSRLLHGPFDSMQSMNRECR